MTQPSCAADATAPPLMKASEYRNQMTHEQAVAHLADFAYKLGYKVFAPRTVLAKGYRREDPDQYLTAYSHESGKGFPDITAVGHGLVVFIEVKTGKATLEPEQREWRDLICSVEDIPESRVVWLLARPQVFDVIEVFLRKADPSLLSTR